MAKARKKSPKRRSKAKSNPVIDYGAGWSPSEGGRWAKQASRAEIEERLALVRAEIESPSSDDEMYRIYLYGDEGMLERALKKLPHPMRQEPKAVSGEFDANPKRRSKARKNPDYRGFEEGLVRTVYGMLTAAQQVALDVAYQDTMDYGGDAAIVINNTRTANCLRKAALATGPNEWRQYRLTTLGMATGEYSADVRKAARDANPKRKTKKPHWKLLIDISQSLWETYDGKPSKGNLVNFGAHATTMKEARSAKVKAEGTRSHRAYKREMKAHGWKEPKVTPMTREQFQDSVLTAKPKRDGKVIKIDDNLSYHIKEFGKGAWKVDVKEDAKWYALAGPGGSSGWAKTKAAAEKLARADAKKTKAKRRSKGRATKKAVRDVLAKSAVPWEWVSEKPGRILASKGKRTVELRKWFKGSWDKGWVVSVIENGEVQDEYRQADDIMTAIKEGEKAFKKRAAKRNPAGRRVAITQDELADTIASRLHRAGREVTMVSVGEWLEAFRYEDHFGSGIRSAANRINGDNQSRFIAKVRKAMRAELKWNPTAKRKGEGKRKATKRVTRARKNPSGILERAWSEADLVKFDPDRKGYTTGAGSIYGEGELQARFEMERIIVGIEAIDGPIAAAHGYYGKDFNRRMEPLHEAAQQLARMAERLEKGPDFQADDRSSADGFWIPRGDHRGVLPGEYNRRLKKVWMSTVHKAAGDLGGMAKHLTMLSKPEGD